MGPSLSEAFACPEMTTGLAKAETHGTMTEDSELHRWQAHSCGTAIWRWDTILLKEVALEEELEMADSRRGSTPHHS